MIDIVADLHLHSKYSRAVSPQMIPPVMAQFGKAKGLDLLATGDWTHPMWFREIRSYLDEAEDGIYKIKNPAKDQEKTRFLLSVEIACIYTQGGKGRRIHNLVFVPSFEVAEKVNKAMIQRGFNLSSDGRPIIGFSSKNLLQMLLEIDERCLLIPAHVWTPWFGIYGAMSGFESLSEAFGELADKVYGIETGLSSDPEMNWQIEELNTRSILSFSDAHSAPKMGREATVFRLENLSYENIRKAIMAPSKQSVIPAKAGIQGMDPRSESGMTKNQIATSTESRSSALVEQANSDSVLRSRNDDINKVLYTIEFYPEEGKYHYSGHRNCNITMTPEEQRASNGICPVCKRHVTDGVMRRVQELAQEHSGGSKKQNPAGLMWISDPKHKHSPFVKIVPLLEIIAEALAVPVGSPKAKVVFDSLCIELESELNILLKVPIADIEKAGAAITTPEKAKRVAEGVKKVREAHIVIKPGYDGVYGVVKIWNDENKDEGLVIKDKEEEKKQIGLEF